MTALLHVFFDHWRAKRAYLVVQLARYIYIYIYMYVSILVPCINCVLAYGTCAACGVAHVLRANVTGLTSYARHQCVAFN